MKKMNQINKVASLGTRRNMLSACVSVALVQMAGAAWADSGYGADNLIGNADNPGYNAGPVQRDADVVGAKRTPSGQLYEIPRAMRETPSDGTMSGEVELGLMHSDDRNRYSKRNEYSDPQTSGLLINSFSLSIDNALTNYFLNLNGGAPTRDDQFYNLSFGSYNNWKVKAFYNETPHVFSDTFKQFYTLNGNTLLPVAAAANAAAAVPLLNALPDTEVGLKRQKGGVQADHNISENWKVWGSLNREERKGERPFASVGSATFVEGFEPINHTTDDMAIGLSYMDKLTNFNLRATRSEFRNGISTLYTRTPAGYVAGAAFTPATVAVYDMPPDNEAYNVKADVTHKMPELAGSMLNASYSWGSSRQNDPLLQYVDPVADPGNTQPLWNGSLGQSTSRATSNARIDTQLFNLGWSLRPIEDLSVKAAARRYETRNKSGIYYGYNPLTGAWSQGTAAGLAAAPTSNLISATGLAGGPCVAPPGFTPPVGCVGAAPAGNNPFVGTDVFSTPRDYKQTNYTLTANLDIDDTSSLEGLIERENFDRTYRERDKTREDKWRLGYVNSALKDTTLRATYEQDRRRGSFYDPLAGVNRDIGSYFGIFGIPYSRAALLDLISKAGTVVGGYTYPTLAFIQGAIVNSNHNLGGWQRSDIADRDQNILNARLNYMATDNLDVGGMLQLKRVKYPANANKGTEREDLNTYNLDFNYQVSSGFQINGYYSRQEGKQRSWENYSPAGVDGGIAYAQTACNGGAVFTAATLGANLDCVLNNLVNPANAISVDTRSNEDVLGIGLSKEFGGMLFGANYTYSKGKTTFGHAYKVNVAGTTGVTAAQAATEFPDIIDERNTLDLSLLIPVSKEVSTRLMYRYETFRVDDWHYYSTAAYGLADRGPIGFNVNTIGVLVNFKM